MSEEKRYNGDLILLRGLPGSGKTTLGNVILSTPNSVGSVLSADDYFTNEKGEYNFDFTKLRDAHNDCQVRCADGMRLGLARIVVANTFTQEWEMKAYYELAERYNYRVHALVVENRHNSENTHNVPADKIEQMKARFEVIL